MSFILVALIVLSFMLGVYNGVIIEETKTITVGNVIVAIIGLPGTVLTLVLYGMVLIQELLVKAFRSFKKYEWVNKVIWTQKKG